VIKLKKGELEIETDKATMEFESFNEGTLLTSNSRRNAAPVELTSYHRS
jgi:pyruvate/2-oxoglutarate dehydrogenase complex dihydrolipoamide acyltransferase (E2) component